MHIYEGWRQNRAWVVEGRVQRGAGPGAAMTANTVSVRHTAPGGERTWDPKTFILYTIIRFQLCSLTLNNALSVQLCCANAP